MTVRENVGAGVMGLAWMGAWVLGAIIHVYTIVIAYSLSGLVAAVITLAFPVVSQVYWFFKVASFAGFGATYCITVMAFLGLLGLGFAGALLAASGE